MHDMPGRNRVIKSVTDMFAQILPILRERLVLKNVKMSLMPLSHKILLVQKQENPDRTKIIRPLKLPKQHRRRRSIGFVRSTRLLLLELLAY